MPNRDFLHCDAETKLCGHYTAAGAVCRLLTNSEHILEAARQTFLPAQLPLRPIDFSMRFWVDPTDSAQGPWPKPYVRGLDHLVFASFHEGISFLADLRRRHIIGRFSPAMAADQAYWRTVIFPILLTIVSASVGIAELHCACVAKDDRALLLAGPSGSGKSTLALALSQVGFGFASDDRTFCSLENGDPQVWALPTPLKLRPEATHWFGSLPNPYVTETRKGKSFWLEPEAIPGLKRIRHSRPSSILFLDRQEGSGFCLTSLSSAEALDRFNHELIDELPEAASKRSKTLRKLIELPCWNLSYGGRPQAIAEEILNFLPS